MVVWGVEVQRDESMERRTPMRMFVKTFMLRLVVDRFRFVELRMCFGLWMMAGGRCLWPCVAGGGRLALGNGVGIDDWWASLALAPLFAPRHHKRDTTPRTTKP
jgi:hypothetical protein